MLFRTIGISLTHECTAECAMCCYECSPTVERKLETDLIMDIIQQAEALPYIEEMVFSGGEPFLYYDELLTYIKEATARNLFVSCYTNAYWCDNIENTVERLKELKSSGLKIIRTSYDVYHHEYIPVENMRNLLMAAKKIGLKCTINVGVDKKTLRTIPDIFYELGSSIFEVDMVIYPFVNTGSAKKNLQENDFVRNIHIRDLRCKYDGIIAIMPDGDVFPCCSPCNIVPFALGNIREGTLREIIEKYKKNSFFSQVLISGIQGIVEDIKRNQLFSLEEYYVDACDLCRTIFNDREKLNILNEFYNKQKM